MKNERIVECDWIRALAALLVVLYHYTSRYPTLFQSNIDFKISFTYGAAGVNIFFFLSGFLALHSLNEKTGCVNYVKRRIKRLYPEYWMSMLITTIFLLILLHELFPGWKIFLINISMLQGFCGIPNVDGAYWTLAYEIRFYLFIFFIIKLKQLKNVKKICILWLLLSIMVAFGMRFGNSLVIIRLMRYIIMPEFCAPFVAGIFVYFLRYQLDDILCYVGLVLSFFLSFFTQEYSYFVALIAMTITMIIILLLRKNSYKYRKAIVKLSNIKHKPLTCVAQISYPLYLLHQYIGYAILQNIENKNINNEIVIIFPILIALTLAFIVNNISRRMI